MSRTPRSKTSATRVRRAATSRSRKKTTRQRLAAAIDGMPRRDRHVLNLILLEGMTELEAAEALNIQAPMVHRGFVALMRKLHRVAHTSTGRTGRRTTPNTRTTRLRRAS